MLPVAPTQPRHIAIEVHFANKKVKCVFCTFSHMRQSDLRQVPSQYIVDGMDRLPPCGPESSDQPLEIEVPFVGCFRVFFRPRKQARRGWPTCWIWLPSRAERLENQQERHD